MGFFDAIGAVAASVSPFVSAGISYVSNALNPSRRTSKQFTENYKNKSDSSSGSGGTGGTDGTGGTGGTDGTGGTGGTGDGTTGDGTTASTDNTAENVKKNDPEKNKTLAEIRMSEELRNTFSLTIKIPHILEGVHTNQFFWLEVTDDFYDKNYPTIMNIIANKKFGRYAGFVKHRFFIDKVVQRGGVDGFGIELTLNPIAPSHGTYVKMQQDAEKALIQALNDNSKYGGGTGSLGGGAINISGVDCDAGDKYNSHNWAGHRCKPPKCTSVSKILRGNSSRQYAKDTAAHNRTSEELVSYVKSQVLYQYYADNPYGEKRCPENMWTGSRPIRGNCADYARMLKVILDVNGYQSIICHIPGHFYNAIWENGKWTVCDLCHSPAYGHANHENERGSVIPVGTWDNPVN